MAPDKFCNFTVIRELGSGGMGTVYHARDQNGREVALKVMSPDLVASGAARERFQLESMLHPFHANIVQVYEAGECDGTPFFAMQFVDGRTLDLVFKSQRPTPRDLVGIIGNIAAALDTAHMRGVIHRDVKPSNILIRARDGMAFLTDFGVAKTADMNITKVSTTGQRIGTPRYMSPEQASGKQPIPQSDIYSLAIVVYEALAGRPPFVSKDSKIILDMQRRERPPDLHSVAPSVTPAVSAVVMRALRKDPTERYPTAGEFAAAFQRSVLQTASHPKLWVVAGLAAASILAAGLAGVWMLNGAGQAKPQASAATATVALAAGSQATGTLISDATAVLPTETPFVVLATATTAPATALPVSATSTLAPTNTPTNTPRPPTRTPTVAGTPATPKP